MRLYQEALGYPIPNGAAEGKAAKEILKHYTPEQAIACYHKLKGQKFWAEMHLGLASVNKQLGAFVGSQDTAVAPLTDEEVERLNRELNGEQL
ncbi:hypothetical protein PZC41_14360, partial [Staphylococcus aureus]|uniref:hypothetical protein n=1 Tax=Staphylococcus aureus TaxID=1280 RepID=UPI0023B0007E